MATRIETQRRSAEIEAALRERLLGHEMQPQDRLPSETELAAQFGASRATVREALRSLEARGLIVIKRGAHGGPHVAPRSLDWAGRSLEDSLRAHRTPIEEVTEARLLVEPVLAKLAAERRSKDELRAIETTLIHMRSRLDSGENPVTGNLEFHRLVALASGNGVLVVVLDACLGVLEDVVGHLEIHKKMVSGMLEAHQTIFEAVEKGRPEKAFRLMKEHVHEAHRGLARACLLF